MSAERIGRFVVVRKLGAGGMGAVYEARDPELSRSVAVKVLRDRGGDAMRLLREAQALARISHPNVVSVFELGSHDGQVFVAMELVDGVTLDAHLGGGARGWREIVALFVAAGRGLAAVHAQGLLHRDVKPSNILVDGHGRVRIGDFGLARVDDDASSPGRKRRAITGEAAATTVDQRSPGAAADDATADTHSPELLASPLTETGAVIGTPRYMAPEQHAGLRVTRAADQFAYCVALWEALYGEHPFGASRELVAAVVAGRRRPAPGGRGVPAWLERAVARGLSHDPLLRWPSIDTLVDELEHRPRRRRRRAVAAAMLGAIGAAVAGGVLIAGKGGGVDCDRAGAEIDAAWTPLGRGDLLARFAKERPYGADVAGRVADGLDAYAHTWRDARADACRATHVRGEQSADLLDRRGACFDEGASAVRALVARLEAADGAAVDHAIDAVAALPDLDACSAARVSGAAAPDRDPRAAAIRAMIADARAAYALGKIPDAIAAADRAIAAARALDDPTLTADALLAHGEAVIDTGAARGRADLEEAETLAARAHDGELEAGAASLLFAAAANVGDAGRADSLEPPARAAIARVGRSRWSAEELGAEAQLAIARARFAAASAACDRIDALPLADHAERAIRCRCNVALTSAHYDDAGAPCRAYLDATIARYGEHHALTANVLHSLAVLDGHLAKYDDELVLDRRALAIHQAAYGDSLDAVKDLGDIADTLMRQNKDDDALATAQQALDMVARLGNPKNDVVAVVHMNMGSILQQMKRGPEAIEHLEAAVALTEELQGPTGRNLTAELNQLARAQVAAGRGDDALATYHRAQALAEKAFGLKSQQYALVLGNEAKALLALHRPREAIPLLEQSRAMADDVHFGTTDVAFVNAILGEAYGEAGDHAHAREALLRARALYVAAGPDFARDVKEVDDLLNAPR